jgi:hypothetical protein
LYSGLNFLYFIKGGTDMTRTELEMMMKEKKIDHLDIYLTPETKLAKYCSLSAGKLKDYTGHVACGLKEDIYAYNFWFGKGDCDKVVFKTKERIPLIRGGLHV